MDILIFDVLIHFIPNSRVIVNNNSEQIVDQSKRLGYD